MRAPSWQVSGVLARACHCRRLLLTIEPAGPSLTSTLTPRQVTVASGVRLGAESGGSLTVTSARSPEGEREDAEDKKKRDELGFAAHRCQRRLRKN